MLRVITAYISAIIVVAIMGNIGLLFLVPFRTLLRKSNLFNIAVSTGANICSNILAVYIVFWLSSKLKVEPSFAMLIVPLLLTLSNDFKRLDKVKRGISRVRDMLEMQGEQYCDNTKLFEIRSEYAYLIGDVIGLSLGAIFFP